MNTILGAFRSTPISSLLIEACLLPLNVLFRAAKLRYAYWIACCDPVQNIGTSTLQSDFPIALPSRDPLSIQIHD
jgi:hypothetical protein